MNDPYFDRDDEWDNEEDDDDYCPHCACYWGGDAVCCDCGEDPAWEDE